MGFAKKHQAHTPVRTKKQRAERSILSVPVECMARIVLRVLREKILLLLLLPDEVIFVPWRSAHSPGECGTRQPKSGPFAGFSRCVSETLTEESRVGAACGRCWLYRGEEFRVLWRAVADNNVLIQSQQGGRGGSVLLCVADGERVCSSNTALFTTLSLSALFRTATCIFMSGAF